MSNLLSPGLRYFLQAVQCGSVRLAAERLHVAPSAISRQIAQLEHEIGTTLLIRTRRGVVPTEQGRLVALYGQRVGRGAERLRSALDDLGDVRRGRVSIATVEGMLDRLLPAALATFRDAHPGVTVAVQVAGTHEVAEAVLREAVEIGIALDTPRREEVRICHTWAQPLYAVVHPDHPLAKRSGVSVGEALDHPHILPDSTFGIRMLIERAASACAAETNPIIETNSIDLCKSYVRSGRALTFLPPMAFWRDVSSGALLMVPLVDETVQGARMDVFTQPSRPIARAAETFLVHLRAAIQDADLVFHFRQRDENEIVLPT